MAWLLAKYHEPAPGNPEGLCGISITASNATDFSPWRGHELRAVAAFLKMFLDSVWYMSSLLLIKEGEVVA